MKRVLITGPTRGIERYADAAREAKWEAVLWPLLQIQPQPGALDDLDFEAVDLIAVTSANAVSALSTHAARLAHATCASIGQQTTRALRSAGFEVTVEGNGTASQLAELIQAAVSLDRNILWPRGNLARELGHGLSIAGYQVAEVVAYTTAPAQYSALPKADAVFIASPSAVATLRQQPVLGIAIGPTTSAAFHDRFGDAPLMTLSEPRPSALKSALSSLC